MFIFTEPSPPKRVRLDGEPGEDYLKIQWERPAGDVDEYIVRVKQQDGVHCVDDQYTTTCILTVAQLLPGARYCCAFTSLSGEKESAPAEISFITGRCLFMVKVITLNPQDM